MDVSDIKVILIFFGSDFKSTDENILEFTGVEFSFSRLDKFGKVAVQLDVEASVPLTVFGLVGDESVGVAIGHVGS